MEAFRKYFEQTVPRTVFIIRTSDMFVAIRSDGTEIARNKNGTTIESEVKNLAADPMNNIWAIARVVAPKDRKRTFYKRQARSL